MAKFVKGFEKTAWDAGKTINDMIGNPFGKARIQLPPKPPTPPPAPANVAVGGKTIGQMIGFPGS